MTVKLARYLQKESESEAAFARRVEAPRSAVHKWLNGTLPSPHYMRAIYRETDGVVTPNDFYGLRRRPKKEQAVNWADLDAQFQVAADAWNRGEISEDEYRLVVADLERQVRELLELDDD